MHSHFYRILGFLVFLTTFSNAKLSFADGWTWGPFSKASSSRDSSPLYSNSSSTGKSWIPSMKLPKMPWSSNTPRVSSYSRSNTSAWSKVSKTSKRWWNRTTELLDPYPDPTPPSYSTTSGSQKAKPSYFQSWFSAKEPDEPKTPNDFLGRPKLN